jgi:IS6 family transposase
LRVANQRAGVRLVTWLSVRPFKPDVLQSWRTSLLGLRCMRRERPALFKGRHFEAEIIVLCVRRYLRYALSLRNLEEIMVERNVQVDHVTIWRWIQRYAPELSRRCSRNYGRRMGPGVSMKPICAWPASGPIYIERWIPRATPSSSCSRRSAMLMRPSAFFQKALRWPNHPCPRVINVDGNPAYPKVIEDLKRTRELGRRCRCRPVRYLNNIVEQDHRAIKRRVRASQGFRSLPSAWRTIQGIETINMIRKGQIRWLPKNDLLGHAMFISGLFGVAMLA